MTSRVVALVVSVCAALAVPAGAQESVPDQLRTMIEQLRSTDPATRGAALDALRKVNDPAAVPMLTAALMAAPPYPETVLEALSFFPDPRKIPALISAARPYTAERGDAIEWQFPPLGVTGAAALLDAIDGCGYGEWEPMAFREWAARTAGKAGTQVLPLLRRAAVSKIPCRRWAAMLAWTEAAAEDCLQGGQCEARSVLQRGTRDSDERVADAARAGIEHLDWEPTSRGEKIEEGPVKPLSADRRRALRSTNPAQRLAAIEAIGEHREVGGHAALVVIVSFFGGQGTSGCAKSSTSSSGISL